MRAALVAAMCLSFTLGCGQKGNLYLRDSPPAGMRPAKSEPYKPVPYPSEPGDDAQSGKK